VFEGRNIARAIEDNASRRGLHPAIIEDGKTITYAELDRRVRKTADYLKACGAADNSAGDTIVGVCLRDTAEHLVLLFAVARLGAVILPLDWRWTDVEKQNIVDFFEVGTVIVDAGAAVENVSCIELDDAWHAGVNEQPGEMPCASGGSRPVVLSLSSGTTGRPKGPMLTHDQFTARFVMQWVTLGFNQHDRYLSATPIYFGGGRSFTMGCLFTGSTVIMFAPPYKPEELIKAVADYRATTLLLVPTLLRQLLQLPQKSLGEDRPLLGGLNRLLSTGAILQPDERAAVMKTLNPEFINYYGSTEGGGTSVLLPKHQGNAASSVGEAIYQTQIEVVDDNGKTLPTGEPGLIRYRSQGVSDSFYRDAEASAEAFRDGWFYPGDIGKLDEEGLLYLVGRSKDVIIRGGVNIYPAEVEQVLLRHSAVTDAVAVAWPHPARGEDVAVFVVLHEPVDEEMLEAHCKEHLAPYKVPKGIFFIEELPKTGLGKVKKNELIEKLPVQ